MTLFKLTWVVLATSRAVAFRSVASPRLERASTRLLSSQFEDETHLRLAFEAAAPRQAELGAYGELPLDAFGAVLRQPVVSAALRAAATRDDGAAGFVDIGSGRGRLVDTVARAKIAAVGIEANRALHDSAVASFAAEPELPAESICADVYSEADTDGAAEVAGALRAADLVVCYSTAFPCDDGLRLPELSVALASSMRAGSVAVTTDKWLVGRRFRFAAHATLPGEDKDGEPIQARARETYSLFSSSDRSLSDAAPMLQAFVWQLMGAPRDANIERAEIELQWMGDDACGDNPEACEALMSALGMDDDDDDDEDD